MLSVSYKSHIAGRSSGSFHGLALWGALSCVTYFAGAQPAFCGSDSTSFHDELYEFHIPPGGLEAAIAGFTRQTHTSVLYDADLVKRRAASAVNGWFSYSSALEMLLMGTGLQVRYADDKSFVLVDGAVVEAADAGGDAQREASITLGMLHVDGPEDFSFYGTILATDLQRALSRQPGLRSVTLFVQANLWVDPGGRVAHAELARSTGDSLRDERLVDVLKAFAVSRPPPQGLPQPVTVSIDFRHI